MAETNPSDYYTDGKSKFILLESTRPDLAEKIIGTSIDPCLNDEHIPFFHEWLYLNWE